jgi:hypothetical protein
LTDYITGAPETFDLIAAIEGTSYPEDTVRFLFDARAANALAALQGELNKLLTLGRKDEYNDLEPVYEKALEDLKDSIFTVTVRAVPREVKKAALLAADAKYPPELHPLTGVEKDNFEKLEYLNVLNWQSHIVKWEDPQGRVVNGPLDTDLVQKILDKAPEASIEAVTRKINELETGAKAGYERAVQELDFLSGASHEAEPADTPQQSE